MEFLARIGADPSDAYTGGRIVGLLFIGGGALLGAIKCVTIARRETTQTLCVLSLACILGVLVISQAAMAVDVWRSESALRVLVALLVVALIVAAPILAIVGLVRYRGGHGRYVQGKKQAIWALALFGVFGAVFVHGLVRAMGSRADMRMPMSAHRPADNLVFAPFGVSVGLGNRGWWTSKSLEGALPGCLAALEHRDGAALAVVPYDIPAVDGEITSDTLVAAAQGILVAQFGLHVEPAAARLVDVYGDAYGFEFERSALGRDFVYRSRLVRRSNLVFLIHAWSLAQSDAGHDRMMEALRAVRIGTVVHSPIPHDWPKGSAANRAGLAAVLGDLAYTGKRPANAAEYLQVAVRLEPTNEDYLFSAFRVLNEVERYAEAAALYREFVPIRDRSLELRSWGPYFDLQLGATERALRDYAQLFADGHRDEEDLKIYVGALHEAESYDAALRVLQTFIDRHGSVRAERWLGQMQSAVGQHDDAIATFRALRARRPSDPGMAYEVVRALYLADRSADALALAEEAVAADLVCVELYQYQALSAMDLARHREAKRAVEAGLELDATNGPLQDLQRQVSDTLGESAHSHAKEPIPAVEVPDALQRLVARASNRADALGAGHPVVYLSRLVAMEYRAGTVYRWTHHVDYVIGDPSRLSPAGIIGFAFSPVAERIYVNRLDVLDAEGELIARGDPDSYYVERDSTAFPVSDDLRLVMPIPGVRPGVHVRVVVTTESRSPPATFPMEARALVAPFPSALVGFSVQGDVEGLVHRAVGALTAREEPGLLYWFAEDVPANPFEDLQVHQSECVPYIWVADGGETWESVTRSYLDRMSDRLRIAPKTAALAQQILPADGSEEAQVAALARHVRDSLSYQAVGFGPRAMVPEPVPQTLERGWGDCKDHALLLHQLLGAAGIESHLALIQTGQPTAISFPSLAEFSHMIVYVPALDRFIDTVDKASDAMARVPWGLENRESLVLDLDRPRLIRTPVYRAEDNEFDVQRRVVLSAPKGEDRTATYRVTTRVAMRGFYAGSWRAALRQQSEPEREASVRGILSAAEPLDLVTYAVEALDESDEPLVILVEYIQHGALHASGDALLGSLPSPWESTVVLRTAIESRRTPFELRVPTTLHSETELVLPPGIRLMETPPEAPGETSPYGTWTCAWVNEGPRLRVTYRHVSKAGRFPAEQYAEFVKIQEAALAPLRRTLRIRVE